MNSSVRALRLLELYFIYNNVYSPFRLHSETGCESKSRGERIRTRPLVPKHVTAFVESDGKTWNLEAFD
jgi:hypothetical protein